MGRSGRRVVAAAIVVMSAALRPRTVGAEKVDDADGRTGSAERIVSAAYLRPFAGGLLTLGGSSLRFVDRRSGRTKTLLRRPGDNLSRLDVDEDRRQLLAVWEKDPDVHVLRLDAPRGVRLSKPPRSAGASLQYIDKLAITPDGRRALLYEVALQGNRRMSARFYGAALDPPGPTELLVDPGAGLLVWGAGRGALFLAKAPKFPVCDHETCGSDRLVAYDFSTGTPRERDIFRRDAERDFLQDARVATGSTDDLVVLVLQYHYGPRFALLSYRPGDGTAELVDVPQEVAVYGGPQRVTISRKTNELLYLVPSGDTFDLWRQPFPLSSAATRVRLPAAANAAPGRTTPVYGFGARASGEAWLQRVDDLLLVSRDGVTRAANVRAMLGGRPEWAGSHLYLESPEELWVGVEVRGSRDFVRVRFADLDRRATALAAQGPTVFTATPSPLPGRLSSVVAEQPATTLRGRPSTVPATVASSDEPPTCTRCGPAPMYPSRLCADGRHQGGRGPCIERRDGTCSWLRLVCPEELSPDGAPCGEAECGAPPVASRWSCHDGATGGFDGCKRTRAGSCGWVQRPCLGEAQGGRPRPIKPPAPAPSTGPAPAPVPAPAPPHTCSPLPRDAELRKWPVGEVCEPGGGPAPPPLVMVRALGDGTFIFSLRDRCFRARYKTCYSK